MASLGFTPRSGRPVISYPPHTEKRQREEPQPADITEPDRVLQKLGVPDLQQCKLVKRHKIFRTVLTAISIAASLN